MRVLHLLASPAFSGPAELITELALAQRRAGLSVSVAVDRKRRQVPYEELAVPRLDALGLLEAAPLSLSVKSTPVELVRDVRVLKRLEVDVVHAHFSHDHLLAALSQRPGRRLVRSLHAPRSLTHLTPAADAWTVPTAELGRRLLGQRVALLPALVPAGLRPAEDRPALRSTLGLPGGRLVGMVSSFQPSRHHLVALDAFALLAAADPAVALVLIGDGPLERTVRARVAALGLERRVTFSGYLRGDAFSAHLKALDVLWLLGLGNDFSGRAAAQARACGVAVVAVDEGALSSLADAVVPLEPAAIAAATTAVRIRPVVPESADAVAARCLQLYL